MPKRKPSQRRHPEKTPQQPRDRLAEIRAEIQDVQAADRNQRREGAWSPTLKTSSPWCARTRNSTKRLFGPYLMAQATQLLSTTRRTGARPAPWLKGRVTRSRIKADAHVMLGQRASRSSSGRPTSAATVTAVRRARGCTRCSCSGACRTVARRPIVCRSAKSVAMLSSLEEVEQVLSDRGQPLDYKTIRTIAYRFAYVCPGRPACGGP